MDLPYIRHLDRIPECLKPECSQRASGAIRQPMGFCATNCRDLTCNLKKKMPIVMPTNHDDGKCAFRVNIHRYSRGILIIEKIIHILYIYFLL